MTETNAEGATKSEPRSLGERAKSELREWLHTFAIFIPVFFVFSFLFYELRVIPSESMVPNLQVGDRVVTNKFAYGYSRFSVPWGLGRFLPLGKGRMFGAEPERGDVVVFMHPHFRRVMIKRVIGLPGDRIQVRDERLYVDGEPAPTEFVRRVRYVPHRLSSPVSAREYSVTVGDQTFLSHELRRGADTDNTVEFVVPEGHVFFMGDNRDNSKDARDRSGHCPPSEGVIDEAGCPPRVAAIDASVGFVPLDHLMGRAETVLFSTYRCRGGQDIDCPPPRVWRGL